MKDTLLFTRISFCSNTLIRRCPLNYKFNCENNLQFAVNSLFKESNFCLLLGELAFYFGFWFFLLKMFCLRKYSDRRKTVDCRKWSSLFWVAFLVWALICLQIESILVCT